jgi:hypothetical protein
MSATFNSFLSLIVIIILVLVLIEDLIRVGRLSRSWNET